MKRYVWLIVFLLMIGVVSAEFSEDNAFTWLESNIQWSQASIEEISFTTIALDSLEGANQLKINNMDDTGCFPKNNCNSKDTALAMLALSSKSESIADQLEYLDESLISASADESEWWLQVVTNTEGSCDIAYDGGTYNLNFDETGAITPGGGSWIKFSNLPSFNFDGAVEELSVDCSDMDYIQKISILKVSGYTYRIVEESDSKIANFEISNGCYAINKNDNSCDVESTFYVSWVLNKLGRQVTTQSYLENELNSVLYQAMLTSIDDSESSNLVGMKEDNSFDNNVYTTSFAVDALENTIYTTDRSEAITWIESQQDEETGRIGNGIKDTATALYLIYSDVYYSGEDDEGEGGETECVTDFDCGDDEECVNGVCQSLTQECTDDGICTTLEYSLGNCIDCWGCGDGYCSPLENEFSCSTDCAVEEECNNDGFCDFGEDQYNCPLDCPVSEEGETETEDQCGDGICGLDEDDFTCPSDCAVEEEKGSLLWLWIIIIIVILAGGGYFIFTKLKKDKGGEKTPSYMQKPRVPPRYMPQRRAEPIRRTPKDEAMERELDKSISQAKELLKRRK